MRNRDKIGIKLIAGFVFIAVFSAIIGSLGLRSIDTINKLLRDMYLDKFVSAVELENATIQAESYHQAVYQHISIKDEPSKRRIAALMHDHEAKMNAYLENYRHTRLIDREKEILSSFGILWNDYIALIRRVLALSKQNRDEEATAILLNQVEPVFHKITDLLYEDVNININEGKDAFEQNGQVYHRITSFLIVRLVITFITTIIMGVYLTLSITKPLMKIVGQAHAIARGDINQGKLAFKKRDEIGTLANSFGKIIDSLRLKANMIERLENKDLSIEVKPVSEKDVIGLSLEKMQISLNEVLSKANVVILHVDDGLKRMRRAVEGKAGEKMQTLAKIDNIETQVAQLKIMLGEFKLKKI
jgi:methyl-accepting chemotaxis protein